jgi:hypothetical protein
MLLGILPGKNRVRKKIGQQIEKKKKKNKTLP